MRFTFFLATCFFAASAQAGGTTQNQQNQQTACAFGAFVNETDRAGLNVRESPSASSKIIGKLPANYKVPEDTMIVRVEVRVLASQNGWFLIDAATDNTMLTEKPRRPMHEGKGWVSGKKLAIKTQASKARLAPEGKADTAFLVGNVLDSNSLSKPGQLIACNGKWAQVEYSLSGVPKEDLPEIKINPAAKNGAPNGRVRGWVNRICAIQETSCDGLGNEP